MRFQSIEELREFARKERRNFVKFAQAQYPQHHFDVVDNDANFVRAVLKGQDMRDVAIDTYESWAASMLTGLDMKLFSADMPKNVQWFRGFVMAPSPRGYYSVYQDRRAFFEQDPIYTFGSMSAAENFINTVANDMDSMSEAIWNERCPGIGKCDQDIHFYRRAAFVTLQALGVIRIPNQF